MFRSNPIFFKAIWEKHKSELEVLKMKDSRISDSVKRLESLIDDYDNGNGVNINNTNDGITSNTSFTLAAQERNNYSADESCQSSVVMMDEAGCCSISIDGMKMPSSRDIVLFGND